jgi:pimeloyl-ACP methyl ester carboxylesterase
LRSDDSLLVSPAAMLVCQEDCLVAGGRAVRSHGPAAMLSGHGLAGDAAGTRSQGAGSELWRQTLDERMVTVDGRQVAFLQSDRDGRAVIFVHGNSSSARTWLPVLAGPFGRRFRCLALDLPGHGQSAPPEDHSAYSLPGYAALLAGFSRACTAEGAVVVGWSLGGHIALEAAPAMPGAAGYVIFGTPPVASAAQMADAFLPNPAMNVGFTADVSPELARAYAASFTAPGSSLPLDDFTRDILRTDGAARAALFASVGEGRFSDETAIAATLDRPLAILHGEGDQLVNLGYLQQLSIPTLWRGRVQLIPGAGHAAHREATGAFTELLDQFIADLN